MSSCARYLGWLCLAHHWPSRACDRCGMVSKRDWVCAAVFLVDALAFWLPSVVVHFMHGPRFGVLDVVIISVACPGTAAIAFAALCLLEWGCSLAWRASIFLLGVWFWGPPSMTVAAAFLGGGPHTLSDLGGFVFLWALFPVTTPMMATYDGSLFALFIITCIFAVLLIATLITRR